MSSGKAVTSFAIPLTFVIIIYARGGRSRGFDFSRVQIRGIQAVQVQYVSDPGSEVKSRREDSSGTSQLSGSIREIS